MFASVCAVHCFHSFRLFIALANRDRQTMYVLYWNRFMFRKCIELKTNPLVLFRPFFSQLKKSEKVNGVRKRFVHTVSRSGTTIWLHFVLYGIAKNGFSILVFTTIVFRSFQMQILIVILLRNKKQETHPIHIHTYNDLRYNSENIQMCHLQAHRRRRRRRFRRNHQEHNRQLCRRHFHLFELRLYSLVDSYMYNYSDAMLST